MLQASLAALGECDPAAPALKERVESVRTAWRSLQARLTNRTKHVQVSSGAAGAEWGGGGRKTYRSKLTGVVVVRRLALDAGDEAAECFICVAWLVPLFGMKSANFCSKVIY